MNSPITAQDGWFAGAVVVSLLLVGLLGPARGALRDGFRALARYPAIWMLPVVFALAYASFGMLLRVVYWIILPEELKPWFGWEAPGPVPDWNRERALFASVTPTLEGVAGIFNLVVTTYPISALAALLFLLNVGGHHRVLRKALWKRARVWGRVSDLFLSLCAAAAIVKPALFGVLPWTNLAGGGQQWWAAAAIVDWLSFLFEYLFGVFVQLYLILHVFVWVRGLNFSVTHLIDFAVRRFSVVVKWALVVMTLSTFLIHLPLISAQLFSQSSHGIADAVGYVDRIGRPFMAVFLMLFFGVQVILTFHAETLGHAMRDHFALVVRNPLPVSGFLLFVVIGFFGLSLADAAGERILSEGAAAEIAWSFTHSVLVAAFGSWMLAGWVCLYKTVERGRSVSEEWIRF